MGRIYHGRLLIGNSWVVYRVPVDQTANGPLTEYELICLNIFTLLNTFSCHIRSEQKNVCNLINSWFI